MFTGYFQLSRQPFGATPDPSFLFESDSHRAALDSLRHAFQTNRGFSALIADPGMGKTTLLYRFLQQIEHQAKTVFLFDTLCTPDDFTRSILFDLDLTPAESHGAMIRQLNNFVYQEARKGGRVVIVIDEAQNLSYDVLESVRILTNFETPCSKLIEVVLAGQPQLEAKLAHPSLLQLEQRISSICRLSRFSQDETSAYIKHRLHVAGYRGDPLFEDDAVLLIAEASGGTPRIINTLCFNCLSMCMDRGDRSVTAGIAAEVIEHACLNRIPEPCPERHCLSSPERPSLGSDNTGDPNLVRSTLLFAGMLSALVGALFVARCSYPTFHRIA